jgi:hypothetical protein
MESTIGLPLELAFRAVFSECSAANKSSLTVAAKKSSIIQPKRLTLLRFVVPKQARVLKENS